MKALESALQDELCCEGLLVLPPFNAIVWWIGAFFFTRFIYRPFGFYIAIYVFFLNNLILFIYLVQLLMKFGRIRS